MTINITEAVQAFQNAMLNAGINPPAAIIGDGALHRFHVEGDRKGSSNGAYTLHLDSRPSGWFMHFKTGISATWTLSGKREPVTDTIKQQIQYVKEVRQAEQAEAHAKAAEKARLIWSKAKPITGTPHPYLVTKRIKPYHARLYGDALVIPLGDETGTIVNLQFIGGDGTKRFLGGSRKQGCFSIITATPTDKILICEGFATGSSLHEATGHTVIVAFDAGNLRPVAEAVRRLWSPPEIIIAGDNDTSGVGQKAAREAALACNGKYILPPESGQDWNDFVNQGGIING